MTGYAKAKVVQTIFKDTPKGDYAHRLAETFTYSADFQAPQYLIDAIEAVDK